MLFFAIAIGVIYARYYITELDVGTVPTSSSVMGTYGPASSLNTRLA